MDVIEVLGAGQRYTDRKIQEVKTEMDLRTTKLSKDLNDYKQTLANVNVNQEAKQTTTDYGIVSLPKTAGNGQASASLKGLTATNMIENGDFLDGTTGWSAPYGSLSVNSNELIYTVTSLNHFSRIDYGWGVVSTVGHKCYVRGEIYPKYVTDTWLQFDNSSKATKTVTAEKWNVISGIVVPDAFEVFRFYHATDSEYIVGDTVKYRNILAIDLTATFGAGNEPDLATCDKIFADYFDGTQSVPGACRIKSVGKNLFDLSKAQPCQKVTSIAYLDDSIIVYPSGEDSSIIVPFHVQPGAAYRAKLLQRGTMFYRLGSDNVGETVSSKSSMVVSSLFDNGLWYLGNTDTKPIVLYKNKCMLYRGTEDYTVMPYEPYIESTLYINTGQPLRSLPNGVKDEIRLGSSGYELVQRTGGRLLDGQLNWTGITEYTDTYRASVLLTGYNIAASASGQTRIVAVSEDGNYVETISASTGRKSIRVNVAKQLFVEIEKTKVDAMSGATTLDKFKAYLDEYPITMIHELEVYETAPIQVSGTLLSNPSGTVYWEKALADAGIYADGISVLLEDYAIAELEKVCKVDFETGVETSLDISTAVVAPDGLSFSHPDLADGDIVFFTYLYDTESTIPEMSMEYYDSRYVVQDSVTDKFYTWTVSVADGVASIDLVEV